MSTATTSETPPPRALLAPLRATAESPKRITPTDVSQFVRLEQCERFLRLRLAERAGQKFMAAYDVAPQGIPPLLTLAGSQFEARVEKAVGGRYATREPGRGDAARGKAAGE